MKMLSSVSFLASIASGIWAADPSSVASTNAHPELVSFGFVYIEASPEQQRNLDAALAGFKLTTRKAGKVCETIEDARALLWESINIATGVQRACTEYKGFFWFSRLDRAKRDDRSFASGFAVKKGTGEIYQWKQDPTPISPAAAQRVLTPDAGGEWKRPPP
jgi:hypothetical protein